LGTSVPVRVVSTKPGEGQGVPIKRIQELLGHKDIRVTQAYIKLLRDTKKSASHDMPL
jgi:integrase